MTIISDLPACTQEDGSGPGQVFPCLWDSSIWGDTGRDFVLTGVWDGTDATMTVLPDDTTALCSPGTELNVAATACEVPGLTPVAEPVPVVTAPVPAPAPATLAATGIDPAGALIAGTLIAAGTALLTARRLLAR